MPKYAHKSPLLDNLKIIMSQLQTTLDAVFPVPISSFSDFSCQTGRFYTKWVFPYI